MRWPVNPRHLLTLAEVVRLGSFAAAANELGYTQSAVSQQITELEHRAGGRVVDRRPVRITAIGQVLLDTERAIQAAMTTAATELKALSEGLTGQVRLAAFISAMATFVPPALAQFRTAHPDVRISLREIDLTTDSYDALLRGDIDLAVTFEYQDSPQSVPQGLHRQLLRRDPIVVALPVGHRLAVLPKVDVADIGAEELITTQVLGMLPTENIASAGTGLEFDGGDFGAALSLVANGLGVALLPELALTHPPAGIVCRPMTGNPSTRFIFLCRIQSTRLTVPLARLEECLAVAAAEVVRH